MAAVLNFFPMFQFLKREGSQQIKLKDKLHNHQIKQEVIFLIY